MITIKDPKAMTTQDPRWLTWYVQQRRFERIKRGGYTAPSLVLSFENEAYQMGAKNTPPDYRSYSDLITFTRASGGGITNAAGQFEWVGNNVPRITYDPVTLKRLGQLIEEQRTNLILRSTLEGGTAGTVGAGAVAPTGWVFPLAGGTVSFPVSALGTIGILTSKTVNTDRPFIQQSVAVLASTVYTLSARVIAAGGTVTLGDTCSWASLPAGATQAYYRNGVLTNSTTPVTLVNGDMIYSVLTVSATAGTATARIGVGAAGDTAVTGSVTLTMPMVEQATSPGSYIPTTASQVTRAADVATVNTLSPWYNASAGTWKVRAAGIVGQPLLTAGTAIITADSASTKDYSLSYSVSQSASSVVIGKGLIAGITYYPRSGA